MQILIILISLLSFRVSFATLPLGLGEKNFEEHAPVTNLFFTKEGYQGNLIFQDHVLEQRYLDSLVQGNLWDLSQFFNWELYNAGQCTNEFLAKHQDTFIFLYRALAISYLYEGIQDLWWEGKQLNFKNTCEYNFQEVFTKCQPQSADMKSYLDNLKIYLKPQRKILKANHNFQTYSQKWIKDLKDPKNFSLAKARITDKCISGSCSYSSKEVQSVFKQSCADDIKSISLLCSEKDSIHGLARVPEANYILSRSEVIQNLEDREMALGCLRRFSQVMKDKELNTTKYGKIFSTIFQRLREKNEISGELFGASNMKIFEDKGLNNILKVVSSPEVVEEVKEEPVAVVIPKKIEVKKEITNPAPAPKKPEPVKVVEKVVEPVKILSSFQTAVNFLKDYDLPTVKVDMLKLRYDYIFSPEVIDLLESSVDQYMARDALTQMQRFDGLGTTKGAVPLMFIKYMIDTEKHTGIYNLISIIGNKFYVENDLDGKEFSKPQFIELKNDETTNHIWQIFVLKSGN